MSHPRAIEKTVALILTFAVALTGLPAVASSPAAGLNGKILRAAGGAPVAGAVVKVAHRPDGRIFQSAKADAKGAYVLGSLPPGQYDVAVEADGGLYVVGGSLALQAGEKRTMSLSVLQEPPPPPEPPAPEPVPEPPAPPEPTPTPAPPPSNEPAKKPAKEGFFHSVWGGTILVLGSAAILGALVASSDDDEPASASPSN